MQLPKNRRKQKRREKRCQYVDKDGNVCGKLFFGIHISKYCEEHRKDKYRIRKRTAPEDINKKNQTIKHSYTEVMTMESTCALHGCNEKFEIKIFPRQYVYPKYCTKHRSEYRRVRHLKNIGREDLIEDMKAGGETTEIDMSDEFDV
ncbi:hypothetical protein [Chitinivibrio alkaliphilus]|uniref:Uncharacterized protein n=1 Tax=Chitinivibrio alkaliphilus ACht1 TaxID=1313304 RepID=U7D5J4_9BACT|nr:hypothetical protein [Chitinivibrio alkaliphilus]ERP31799.1 hypothetical protein CALK_1245 [Chitinivibrio alkaliphilus ACht1]